MAATRTLLKAVFEMFFFSALFTRVSATRMREPLMVWCGAVCLFFTFFGGDLTGVAAGKPCDDPHQDQSFDIMRMLGSCVVPFRPQQSCAALPLRSGRVCLDATALCVLSAGTDRSFRVFHTVRDCLSQELSQKPLVKVSEFF